MHVMQPPDIVEVGTYSVCSPCSGAEHIAPEYLVVISLKNAAGQTGGEQHPQFFALHKMFCGDSATTDHGLRDLAHRIPNQDTVYLAHRAAPIVSCTDKEGVGEVEAIGLSGVEGAVKEVFDGPRHIPKIFRCAKQYTVTGEEIFQSGLERPYQSGACLWYLTGAVVYSLRQLFGVPGLGMIHNQ